MLILCAVNVSSVCNQISHFCRVIPFHEADRLSCESAYPNYKGYRNYKNYRQLYIKGW